MAYSAPRLSRKQSIDVLQQDGIRLSKQVPKCRNVFGKAGRATLPPTRRPVGDVWKQLFQFNQGRVAASMTAEKLVEELDQQYKLPGLLNLLDTTDTCEPHRSCSQRVSKADRRKGLCNRPAQD